MSGLIGGDADQMDAARRPAHARQAGRHRHDPRHRAGAPSATRCGPGPARERFEGSGDRRSRARCAGCRRRSAPPARRSAARRRARMPGRRCTCPPAPIGRHPAAGTARDRAPARVPGGPVDQPAALRSRTCRSSSSRSSRSSRASPAPTSRRRSTPPRRPAPTSSSARSGRRAGPTTTLMPDLVAAITAGRVRQRRDPRRRCTSPRRGRRS